MSDIKEIPFYEAIALIRKSKKPMDVVHTKVSFTDKASGEVNTIPQVVLGPNRKGMNDNLMLGLQSADGDVKHIYMHSILELIHDKTHYKLVWS